MLTLGHALCVMFYEWCFIIDARLVIFHRMPECFFFTESFNNLSVSIYLFSLLQRLCFIEFIALLHYVIKNAYASEKGNMKRSIYAASLQYFIFSTIFYHYDLI